MCGGGYELLTIEGVVPEDELAIAWDTILEEYSDLTLNSESSKNVFEVWKRMIGTHYKKLYIDNACAYMKSKQGWRQEMAQQISDYGYDYIKNLEDREAYLKQIYGVETEAKFLIVQLNQLAAEYARICPQGSEKVIRREIDYEKELAILSQFIHSRLISEELTVFQYCGIVAAYMENYNKNLRHGNRSTI